VAGIPIELHPSWFFVFALVTWSLAAGHFPSASPGWTPLAYWLVGAATGLLFFASVLVHELGHSLVALRAGIPIRGITLFIFGGVARIAREPSSPGVELRVAAAGPLTSFLLGGLCLLGRPLATGMPMLEAPMAWLGRINLMVALFNLIPGFPLDGGRMLRALVWLWTGDLARATQAASWSGQAFALALMGLGVLSALGGDPLGGVWMIFIGWFLHGAAAATQAQSSLAELLRGVTVTQAMVAQCPGVRGSEPLSRLVEEQVLGHGQRCFFIVEDGRLEGLLTLQEVKAVPRERWAEVPAAEVMIPTARLVTVGPGDDLLAALTRMDDARVSQLPVVQDGALRGMLGREEILHYVRVRAELGS
jgi:Zn-dependent protease